MRKTFLAFAFALLIFAGAARAEFELRSLDVSLSVNPDGTAHATEEAMLFITGNQSTSLYEQSIVYNDLSSWATRTGISDIRTHISRAYAELRDLRVRPQPLSNCNNLAQTCYATLVLDYDIFPIQNKTASGIVSADLYKPRTTKYSLKTEAFTFPRTKTDDIILPKGTSLKITLPQEASYITFSKVPDNLAGESALFRFDPKVGATYYFGPARVFLWSDQTLSQFSLSYEIEKPLEAEVLEFFNELETRIFSSVFSFEGFAYLLAAASVLISAIWLHSLEQKT